MTTQESLELSSYIHTVLADYVPNHLTIDYIDHTHSVVSDVCFVSIAKFGDFCTSGLMAKMSRFYPKT